MKISDAVFHLVCMQVREEFEAAEMRADAARTNAPAGRRAQSHLRATEHAKKAAALDLAIAALVDLP